MTTLQKNKLVNQKKVNNKEILVKIPLAQFKGQVDLFGIKLIDDIQDQYSHLMISSPVKMYLFEVLDYLMKLGCSVIESSENSFILHNKNQGAFRCVDCSHKTGDVVFINSSIPYKLYNKQGTRLE